RRLRQLFPDLLTIIVPRHPERGEAVTARIAAAAMNVVRRSRGQTIARDTDIYVADTLGELGLFYRAAPVAFLGGSLVPHGGQNPIEAVRLDAAVLHGPYVHNFADIYAELDRAVPLPPIIDAPSLAEAVGVLLADSPMVVERAAKARAAIAHLSGALEASMA